MRDLIIEHNLKKDSGPLRSAWERAVLVGRALSSPSTGDSAGPSASTMDSAHMQTQNRAKNFWEAAAGGSGASDPSGSAIIDGSAYYVVEGHPTKNTPEDKLESPNANEPLPSPRPSPPRSPSPRHSGSPTKKMPRELWVD